MLKVSVICCFISCCLELYAEEKSIRSDAIEFYDNIMANEIGYTADSIASSAKDSLNHYQLRIDDVNRILNKEGQNLDSLLYISESIRHIIQDIQKIPNCNCIRWLNQYYRHAPTDLSCAYSGLFPQNKTSWIVFCLLSMQKLTEQIKYYIEQPKYNVSELDPIMSSQDIIYETILGIKPSNGTHTNLHYKKYPIPIIMNQDKKYQSYSVYVVPWDTAIYKEVWLSDNETSANLRNILTNISSIYQEVLDNIREQTNAISIHTSKSACFKSYHAFDYLAESKKLDKKTKRKYFWTESQTLLLKSR